jgi:diamine N-acetyltransferase
VELVEITYIHRRAEFQIIIAPEKQGQGYGRATTRLAADYAFRVLNLHKLYLTVSSDNAAAIALYRGCGFTEEGRLKDEYFVDGHYQDALRMYQLQRDFIAREPPPNGDAAREATPASRVTAP